MTNSYFIPPLKVAKVSENAVTPCYQTLMSAGFDFHCIEDFVIHPHSTMLVRTGLCFDIPAGYELQIRSRSGLALKGVVVLNSPATIDSDYVGEVKIILHNFGDDSIKFKKHDRIAQGVVNSIEYMPIENVNKIEKVTDRGSGGFGSTGI